MILATIMAILAITTTIVAYSIVSRPVEYVIDALQDVAGLTLDNSDEYNKTTNALPYFLAGGVVIFIFLVVIWYFVYAHKKEYEQD